MQRSKLSPAYRLPDHGARSDKIDSIMRKRIVVAVLIGIVAIVVFRHAASFLVASQPPEHADLIVVLAGGNDDLRYWNGVRLMQEGYAPRLLLDVLSKGETFGNRDLDLAADFVNRTTPGRSTVCPIGRNSTYDEAAYVERCIQGMGVHSILVVTSDYHTRRAFSILHARLPRYKIAMYPAPDPYDFGQEWWQTRQWAKTTYGEWQRYIWWLVVDRWRPGLVVAN